MNKKFGFLLLVFMCALFINLDGVKAECKCYYSDMSENMTTYVGITFGKNKSDVFLGRKTQNTGAGDNTIDISVDRGDPFRVYSNEIAKKDCSIDACGSIDLRYEATGFSGKSIKIYACDDRCKGSVCKKCTEKEKNLISHKPKLKATKENLVPDGTGARNPDGSYTGKNDGDECDKDCLKKIKDWGGSGNLEFSTEKFDCTTIDKPIRDFLNMFFWIIAIIGIILLIVMTFVEFIKVITLSEEDGLKGAFKHTVIRAVCIVILLLLPYLVTFIVDVINKNANYSITYTDQNGEKKKVPIKYKIGDKGNVTCSVGK